MNLLRNVKQKQVPERRSLSEFCDVLLYAAAKFVDGVEFDFGTNEAEQFYVELLTIEVAAPVREMGFEARYFDLFVNGGTQAYVGNTALHAAIDE